MKCKVTGKSLVVGDSGKVISGKEAIHLSCGHTFVTIILNAFNLDDPTYCSKDHDSAVLKRIGKESKIDWGQVARNEHKK